mmetsp:Transcript_26460/g.23397  ORF Transcript_26460/g.23397 Transcript_26460/m.23397 type:complete len:145 (-) Transcript_26460:195-629(-)
MSFICLIPLVAGLSVRILPFVLTYHAAIIISYNFILVLIIAKNIWFSRREKRAAPLIVIQLTLTVIFNYLFLWTNMIKGIETKIYLMAIILGINILIMTILILQSKYGSRFMLPNKCRYYNRRSFRNLKKDFNIIDVENHEVPS